VFPGQQGASENPWFFKKDSGIVRYIHPAVSASRPLCGALSCPDARGRTADAGIRRNLLSSVVFSRLYPGRAAPVPASAVTSASGGGLYLPSALSHGPTGGQLVRP